MTPQEKFLHFVALYCTVLQVPRPTTCMSNARHISGKIQPDPAKVSEGWSWPESYAWDFVRWAGGVALKPDWVPEWIETAVRDGRP